MRLFVATDVLTDYTHGVIALVAPNRESILEVLSQHPSYDPEDAGEGTYIDHGEIDGPARVIVWHWGGA
jgi:hypothetical protein